MSYQYSQTLVSGSTLTSPAFFVGDFRLVTISVATSTSGTTNIIIQGSNADGLRASDLGDRSTTTNWSNITIIQPGTLNQNQNVGAGLFVFDPPGWRWMRSFITTGVSGTTITFNGVSF